MADTAKPAADPTPAAETKPAEPTVEAPKPATETVAAETQAESKSEDNGSLLPEGESETPKPEVEAAPEPLDLTKLTLPEGLKADDPGLAKLVETLGDSKLSPAQRIEALATQHQEAIKAVGQAVAERIHTDYKNLNNQWIEEVRKDSVLGGEKGKEALGSIAKAIDTWSPNAKETKAAFALTGAGNNPHILRTLHAMAAALTEGKPAQGAPSAGKKSAVDVLYGGSAA